MRRASGDAKRRERKENRRWQRAEAALAGQARTQAGTAVCIYTACVTVTPDLLCVGRLRDFLSGASVLAYALRRLFSLLVGYEQKTALPLSRVHFGSLFLNHFIIAPSLSHSS